MSGPLGHLSPILKLIFFLVNQYFENKTQMHQTKLASKRFPFKHLIYKANKKKKKSNYKTKNVLLYLCKRRIDGGVVLVMMDDNSNPIGLDCG